MGATFARYATSSQGDAGVGVVPLVCSFSVDEVSSTTFSNSDYWVNINEQPQAQNHPREIVFSVHNYEKNADGTKSAPSEIDLQSTFRFYGPKEFLENIAFQILEKGDGNTRIPLTQQYVLPTIIEKATNGTEQISTSDFKMTIGSQEKPADYGEYAGREEETIALTNHDFNATNGTGKIVAIAQTGTEQVATIALTAENHKDVNYKMTKVRGNQTNVDDGNGHSHLVNDMSAPEYYSIHKASEMVFYCLDISLPSMIMQAKKNLDGTYQSSDGQFIFAFTIIKTDDFSKEPDHAKTEEHFNAKGVSLYSLNSDNTLATLSQTAVVKVVNSLDADGKITSSKYSLVEDTKETEFELTDNKITLTDDTKTTTYYATTLKGDTNTTYYIDENTKTNLNNPKWNPLAEDPTQLPYEIGATVKKVFPTDVRVLFTQASQTGGN